MVKLSESALSALRTVADRIEAEPLSINMHSMETYERVLRRCSTCIAGHLVMLTEYDSGIFRAWSNVSNGAVRRLELADTMHILDYRNLVLFFVNGWPEKYKNAYEFVGDDYGANVLKSFDSTDDQVQDVLSARRRNAATTVSLLREIVERGGLWWIDYPDMLM